jgi:serine phosphatase RsbU (regulator of sigma subunit)
MEIEFNLWASRADLKKIKDQMDYWIQRLSNTGGLPSDNQEFQLRKAVLILLAGTCTVLGVFWGLAYFALGLPAAGIIPLGYAAVSAISLLYFFRSKKYKFFCRGQLTLILILPFLLQWHLGGFAASGAVILWSLLAPIGALMFAGTNRAVPWFLGYAILVIISSMIGGKPASQQILPPTAVMTSFLMNIGGVSAIVFFLLRYFGQGRDDAMAALDKEHRRVQHSLSLAMEVQQNLLPNTDPNVAGLDISGKSTYCDETGGDYYDFLEVGDSTDGKIGIVVGDVSDHGIPSALLMATVRAHIRQRCSAYGNIDLVVADVNRKLAQDVKESGRFMTLFYAEIDRPQSIVRWVNAGHDPVMVFDSAKDTFEELNGGSNLALGVMEDSQYVEAQREIAAGQIMVMATDGIWEARNADGEMFGKDRLYKVIRQNALQTAAEIQTAVFESIRRFRQNTRLEDDMTLVVVKVN